jgi:tetratricopeptide (TPR) repeat protein
VKQRWWPAALMLALADLARVEERTMPLTDFDQLWDYRDPAGTEARFRELLPAATAGGDPDLHAQLLTQIARCQGLQRRFEDARRTLGEAERLVAGRPGAAAVRLQLERGRVLNSSGDPAGALPHFEAALTAARALKLDYHAVDAAHMLGIAAGAEAGLAWNLEAIAMAQASTDERARGWLGSLLNNTGWNYHDAGDHARALELFQSALAFRREQGKQPEQRIAEWCVARCLRSLGRLEEALAIQRDLEAQWAAAGGDGDGYVFEELAELLLAQGRSGEAKPYFARAHALLAADPWLQANEESRLARLARLGSGD